MKQYKNHIYFCLISLVLSYLYQNYIPYKDIENLQADEIAKMYNYPTEFHEIVSDSGHIISLLRIQKKNQGYIIDPYQKQESNQNQNSKKTQLKPVMFLHGLFSDMNCFFGAIESEIQPFVLANLGFDVWVVNFRGAGNTLKHVKYSSEDKEFWDFDNNDFANDDLPNFMKFVGEFTNQKIDLVSVSLGGTITYLSLAQQQYYVEKYIGKAILMCPGAQAQNIWILDLFRISNFPAISRALGFHSFKYNSIAYHFAHLLPDIVKFFMSITLEGDGSYNYERAGVSFAHFPASTSIKNLQYMSQLNKGDKVHKFDYGKEKNLEIYGNEQPEEIFIENIRAGEIHIFYGKHDGLVPNGDNFAVQKFVAANVTLHEFKNHGHCSFINSYDTDHTDKMVQILTGNTSFSIKIQQQQGEQIQYVQNITQEENMNGN